MGWMPVVLHIVGGHDGVWDSVVDYCIHGYCHRVTRQNLQGAQSSSWMPMLLLPLVVEHQSWQFSGPVSYKSQYKALWRICPAPRLLLLSVDPGEISQLSRIPWQPGKQMMFLIIHLAQLTLTQKNRENGIRARQRRTDTRASRRAQQPGPSGSPGRSSCITQSCC